MSEPIHFFVLFSNELREGIAKAAKRNRRSFTSEMSVAIERYIEEGASDPPPPYEGTLERYKVRFQEDVYALLKAEAERRRTSMNRICMAAAHRHIEREGIRRK